MEPTADEKIAIINLDTLADWAGLSAEAKHTIGAGDAALTVSDRQAAFTAWGMSGMTHFRLLAVVPKADFDGALDTSGPGGAKASLAVGATCRLMYATARCLCHQDPWPSVAMSRQMASMAAPATPSAPAAAAAAISSKFKVNVVCDQTDDSELEVLPNTEITKLYSNYSIVAGGLPPKDENPTAEQLTVIMDRINGLRIPYADFSIFVPFANRNMKRLKMAGSTIGPDGRIMPIEVYGPPSYDQWEKC